MVAMPDLLAHALIAYSIAMFLSWRYDWITGPYVTTAMAGAFIPDITKVRLILPSDHVGLLLNLPFNWSGIHTLGGSLIAVLIGVTLVAPSERKRVFTMLSLGATTHLIADGLLLTPSGRSFPMFWPLTQYHPPTPGLYLSTQIEPTIVSGAVALVVWFATRNRRSKA